jgi:hypothetical protein
LSSSHFVHCYPLILCCHSLTFSVVLLSHSVWSSSQTSTVILSDSLMPSSDFIFRHPLTFSIVLLSLSLSIFLYPSHENHVFSLHSQSCSCTRPPPPPRFYTEHF